VIEVLPGLTYSRNVITGLL